MLVLEESRPIEFREDRLLVKTLSDDQDLRASYHLRHQVFADRLQWVVKSDDELEVDAYDAPHRLSCLTTTGCSVASFGW